MGEPAIAAAQLFYGLDPILERRSPDTVITLGSDVGALLPDTVGVAFCWDARFIWAAEKVELLASAKAG